MNLSRGVVDGYAVLGDIRRCTVISGAHCTFLHVETVLCNVASKHLVAIGLRETTSRLVLPLRDIQPDNKLAEARDITPTHSAAAVNLDIHTAFLGNLNTSSACLQLPAEYARAPIQPQLMETCIYFRDRRKGP